MSSPTTSKPSPSTRRKHALPAFAPVPRLKERSNGWNEAVQLGFIEALADTGSVRAACRRVNRSEHGAYQLRRHPDGAGFAKAWKAALAIGVQRIEDVAMDRALNGVEVPVYSYGKLIGTRRIYNDRLLMFILRNRAPERFGTGGGEGGSALQVVERRKMKRLKKMWFEEWEAERLAKQVSPAEIRASINRKIEHFRRQVESDTSPRGHEIQLEAEAQARADRQAGWTSGRPYAPYAARAAELYPGILAELRADPENQRKIHWDVEAQGDDDDEELWEGQEDDTPLLEDRRHPPSRMREGPGVGHAEEAAPTRTLRAARSDIARMIGKRAEGLREEDIKPRSS